MTILSPNLPVPAQDAQRLLIVDDDESLVENLVEILEPLGVPIDVASGAKQALAASSQADYGAALVDLRLPDGNGIELMAGLRDHSRSTEVILVTGEATVETAIAAVRDGAFAYVVKPFSPPDLIETTRRALAQAALFRERERLRAELERSERRHRELVEAVPAFVLALDERGRVAVWNRRLEEVTGFSRQEMLGSDGAGLLHGTGPRKLPMKHGEMRLVRWETAQVAAGPGGGARWTYAVGIDVTHEQEMQRRTLRAERLAAVGTMAAGLAHEIRNPLNSATLQLDVLRRRLDRGDGTPETIRPVADVVRSEIERLSRLVNDFLSFAQPRPLDAGALDVNAVCRDIAEFMRRELEQARIELRLELAEDARPIEGDGQRIRQVLLNLVRNAAEAMPDGGHVVLRTSVHGDGPDAKLELEVEDDGVGIPDETAIFDAFYTTKPQGTGLGLSIVHRIVMDHGGTIRVKSRPGCTRFTITLPAGAAV